MRILLWADRQCRCAAQFASVLSLRCPSLTFIKLSLTRIKVPVRSTECVHINCFDASSWFMAMERCPTWRCPLCAKAATPASLFVDESVSNHARNNRLLMSIYYERFFDSIIQRTNQRVEEVIVEPDMEWHTRDNKYASPAWRTKHSARA